MRMIAFIVALWVSFTLSHYVAAADAVPPAVDAALKRAGENAVQLRAALKQTPIKELSGMHFLIAHMPQRDLETLSAEFLREHVQYAYQAWQEAPWRDSIDEQIFLNNVLPYASVNERRDAWRKDFYKRFQPLIKEAASPSEAAAILNQKVFPQVKVRYSTQRPKADQSPYESIEAGMASCTGLSILLVDACRAVGVPARLVGVPQWPDNSGNHTWVEIWDDGWHFTGAAEPTGGSLNIAWFTGRASQAKRDELLYAVYAVSYQKTPQRFPLVWNAHADYVYAVNVTDRYTAEARQVPEGQVEIMFRTVAAPSGERCTAHVKLADAEGKLVFEGTTKDERFDANDHLATMIPAEQHYTIKVEYRGRQVTQPIQSGNGTRLITIELPAE